MEAVDRVYEFTLEVWHPLEALFLVYNALHEFSRLGAAVEIASFLPEVRGIRNVNEPFHCVLLLLFFALLLGGVPRHLSCLSLVNILPDRLFHLRLLAVLELNVPFKLILVKSNMLFIRLLLLSSKATRLIELLSPLVPHFHKLLRGIVFSFIL